MDNWAMILRQVCDVQVLYLSLTVYITDHHKDIKGSSMYGAIFISFRTIGSGLHG